MPLVLRRTTPRQLHGLPYQQRDEQSRAVRGEVGVEIVRADVQLQVAEPLQQGWLGMTDAMGRRGEVTMIMIMIMMMMILVSAPAAPGRSRRSCTTAEASVGIRVLHDGGVLARRLRPLSLSRPLLPSAPDEVVWCALARSRPN